MKGCEKMLEKEYIERGKVHICLDDLSSENLIGNDNDTFISLPEAHDRIDDILPADVVEVKHGEWKYDFSDYPSRYDVHIICTNCNHIFARLTGVNFNYCPNCGAKMDGGKNV